jgi:hypothetical protein
MKFKDNIVLAFTGMVGFLYVIMGVDVYAGELLNIALNGLKSMDCIKFYMFVSHTAVIGVLVKYYVEVD